MVTEHLKHLLDELTVPHRRKGAEALFSAGHVGPVDRVLSAVFFHVSARQWAARLDDPQYLAPIVAGLQCCHGARRVLDIGTGAGGSAHHAAIHFPAAEVVGIDHSRRMLKLARERFAAPNLTFTRASASRLPFPDATFDLIVCFNSVPDPQEAARVATSDAEVLAASSFVAPTDDATAWVLGWEALGFQRVEQGSGAGGGWELFRRGDPPPAAEA